MTSAKTWKYWKCIIYQNISFILIKLIYHWVEYAWLQENTGQRKPMF